LDADFFYLLIGCSIASTSNNHSLFVLEITKSLGSGDGWPLVLLIDKSDYKKLSLITKSLSFITKLTGILFCLLKHTTMPQQQPIIFFYNSDL